MVSSKLLRKLEALQIFVSMLLVNEVLSGDMWEGQNLGQLCEPDNDFVGQHLGCNCSNLLEGGGIADCSNRWIGYNNSMTLPNKMNISIHVRMLDLSKNQLKVLDENTFGNCEGLFTLNFYKNEIEEVKSLNCQRLRKLDLSWNHITKLSSDAFKSLVRLEELNLGFNGLLYVEANALDQLHSLRILILASNPLGNELNYFEDYEIQLDNLEHLETLDMSNTSLPDFPLSLINGTRNLKKLYLRNNLISSLPQGVLHQLSSLEVLDLSGNWFETFVPFGFLGLDNLQQLIVDRMPNLRTIQQHAFAGLTSLKELSCQKNHYLHFIDVMAFRMTLELEVASEYAGGDSHPVTVRLGDNNLNYIEYGLLVWRKLETLQLYRNPWICDCNLQWVSEFYAKKPEDASMFMDDEFRCKEPHIFAGVSVVQVNPEEMLCYSEAATIAGTVGIILFAFLMFSFCSIIILNHMGMLPDWVRKYNIFGSGSSLPKYMRVNPKPTRARRLDRMNVPPERGNEPVPGDLEWDNGDIGPT